MTTIISKAFGERQLQYDCKLEVDKVNDMEARLTLQLIDIPSKVKVKEISIVLFKSDLIVLRNSIRAIEQNLQSDL